MNSLSSACWIWFHWDENYAPYTKPDKNSKTKYNNKHHHHHDHFDSVENDFQVINSDLSNERKKESESMNKNENLKEENQTEIIKEKKRIQIFCLFVCLFVFFFNYYYSNEANQSIIVRDFRLPRESLHKFWWLSIDCLGVCIHFFLTLIFRFFIPFVCK